MFNLANVLTAGNLISGISAIILAATGYVTLAPFAIFLGAIFDFLDGFAARMLKTSGELGKQLDSLADMVTFGVAPGVIMMTIVLIDETQFTSESMVAVQLGDWVDGIVRCEDVSLMPLVALLIPFFALFRLAKFNIDTRQTSSFVGLPTPSMTLFFCTFPLVYGYYSPIEVESADLLMVVFNDYLLSALIVVMSVMMVLPIPLFSLKFNHFNFSGNELRYLFLLISLGLIVFFFVWSLALIVFLYLILSFIENTFIKKNKG